LPLYPEPAQLVDTEPDYYGRPQRLTPEAFAAWQDMKQRAAAEDITLHLISAFRDLEYQRGLIARKLAAGQSLTEILRVNAAPGFSEHHTGRAIDVGTLDCEALVEDFENTVAYQWLEANAAAHGFRLSFPRGNPYGIDYEPWHWCFKNSS
jgi:D-alanyl-D-alanine carboxypeptidase